MIDVPVKSRQISAFWDLEKLFWNLCLSQSNCKRESEGGDTDSTGRVIYGGQNIKEIREILKSSPPNAVSSWALSIDLSKSTEQTV